ncbi:MAG: hypothetical protein ACYC5A_01085 [Thermoleophilia bacterium]
MRTSHLVIAGHSVAIDCSEEALSSYLETELSPFCGGGGIDMKLSLSLGWADSGLCPETASGQINVVLPNGVEVCLEQGSAAGTISLNAIAGGRPGEASDGDRYLYDFLINYVFSLVIQQLQADGLAHIFLIHSCGMVHDGRGYLFAGASGKGKSTIARQLAAGGKKLLGDDMVLVSHDINGWHVHGSPMGGEIPRRALVNDSLPLEAIYLIDQDSKTGWRRTGAAEATAALIGLVVPSYPLAKVAPKQISDYGRETAEVLFEEAALLAGGVPCFRLALSLDDQPWDRLFDDISKREAEVK